ncbi:hypothetical protein J6590_104046, partial [Homalodisca vitripennis]
MYKSSKEKTIAAGSFNCSTAAVEYWKSLVRVAFYLSSRLINASTDEDPSTPATTDEDPSTPAIS